MHPGSAEAYAVARELPASVKQEMEYYAASGERARHLLTKAGKKWLASLAESYKDEYEAYTLRIAQKRGINIRLDAKEEVK